MSNIIVKIERNAVCNIECQQFTKNRKNMICRSKKTNEIFFPKRKITNLRILMGNWQPNHVKYDFNKKNVIFTAPSIS